MAIAVLAGAYTYRTAIADAAFNLRGLSPIVLLVLPLYALWNYLASRGWRVLHQTLAPGAAPSAWKMSVVRLQAQALNLVLPLASIGGEFLRASALSRHSGQVAASGSAVVLDKIAEVAAGVAFSWLGIVVVGSAAMQNGATAAVVLSLLLIAMLGFLPLALGIFGHKIGNSKGRLARALDPIVKQPTKVSRAFYRATAWHFLERVLTGMEIYLIMLATGLGPSPMDALIVSATMTAYTLVFFFVPGQLGAAEAGVVSAFLGLGLSSTMGLTVAMVRRARQLLIIVIGAALFIASEGLSINRGNRGNRGDYPPGKKSLRTNQ